MCVFCSCNTTLSCIHQVEWLDLFCCLYVVIDFMQANRIHLARDFTYHRKPVSTVDLMLTCAWSNPIVHV